MPTYPHQESTPALRKPPIPLLSLLQLDQPLPLCPFPDMYLSGSLSASPPAAGLGFIVREPRGARLPHCLAQPLVPQVALPPYFNWSSFLSAGDYEAAPPIQFSLVAGGSAPSSLLPSAGLPLTIVKGPSTIGGSSFGELLNSTYRASWLPTTGAIMSRAYLRSVAVVRKHSVVV